MSADLRVNDVVKYKPDPRRHDPMWCREGTAIVMETVETGGRLDVRDTYWGSGSDRHMLTSEELESATVRFNLDNYEQVNHGWVEYHPDDREVVTSQHRLQRQEYVRIGAVPDHGTKVENARATVAEREAELASAERRLLWARQDLEALLVTEAEATP